MNNFYIKTNRIFSPIRKYGWIFTLTVAFGGLWFPKLGLLVLPVILALTTLSFFKGRYWCGNFCFSAQGSEQESSNTKIYQVQDLRSPVLDFFWV